VAAQKKAEEEERTRDEDANEEARVAKEVMLLFIRNHIYI
jgi:hypothetical protein